MTIRFTLPVMIICMALLTSCSSRFTYFTQSLYDSSGWTEDDLHKIQFYVSKDVVMWRSAESGSSQITGGKIVIRNGQKVEQIVIKAHTPGVLTLIPKENRFAISFEVGNDSYLMFGPNPNYYNRYALLAEDWELRGGTVHYRGKTYNVDSGSATASLLVDLKKIGSSEVQSRQVKGRTVGGK